MSVPLSVLLHARARTHTHTHTHSLTHSLTHSHIDPGTIGRPCLTRRFVARSQKSCSPLIYLPRSHDTNPRSHYTHSPRSAELMRSTHAHTHTLQRQRTLPHSDSPSLPSTQGRQDRWTVPGTVYGRGKTLALAARSGQANPKTLNPTLLRWQLDLDAGPYHGPGRPPYREAPYWQWIRQGWTLSQESMPSRTLLAQSGSKSPRKKRANETGCTCQWMIIQR